MNFDFVSFIATHGTIACRDRESRIAGHTSKLSSDFKIHRAHSGQSFGVQLHDMQALAIKQYQNRSMAAVGRPWGGECFER